MRTYESTAGRRIALAASIAAAALLVVVMAFVPRIDASATHAGTCDVEATELNGGTMINGTQGSDHCLAGGNGPDIIKGKRGNDTLRGNHGPDKLRGGPGNDHLWGGRGPDTFICGPGKDVVHNEWGTGADVIDDSCEIVR